MLSDPATRLPPEIVAIIFEHCLPPAPQKPAPDRAPLLVAQIDHRWRSIALSSPGLWSSFSFSGSPAMLSLWLERSGERPLALRICTSSIALAERCLSATIPHTHRWRDMTFALPSGSLQILQELKIPFPVLERLSVFVSRWQTGPLPPDSDHASRINLSRAPKLRSLALYTSAAYPVARPFAQLTALRLMWLHNVRFAIAILELCPSLELFVCRMYRDATDTPPAPAHTHSSLAHLRADPETFAHLTLPALSRVKLDLQWPTNDWSLATECLRRLVQRSDCALDCLWLQDDGRIARRELQDLLSQNPIRHLRLDFPDSVRLELLMPILELERVAPHLEHLEIWIQDGWEFAPVLRPLKTRLKRGTLKSFKLHLDTDTGMVPTSSIKDQSQELRRLCALANAGSGLDVLVTASAGDDEDDFILSTTTSAESSWWLAHHAYAL